MNVEYAADIRMRDGACGVQLFSEAGNGHRIRRHVRPQRLYGDKRLLIVVEGAIHFADAASSQELHYFETILQTAPDFEGMTRRLLDGGPPTRMPKVWSIVRRFGHQG